MSAAFAALAPVFALILLGYGLKLSAFLEQSAWRALEKLAYFVFFPVLLFRSLSRAEIGGDDLSLAAAALSGVIAMAAIVLAAKPLLHISNASFTSLFQGATRWNAFFYLAAMFALFSADVQPQAAIVIGAIIPALNVMSVLVLSRWGDGQSASPRRIAFSLLKNPFLIGVSAGLLANFWNVATPPPLGNTIDILAAAALPAGLLAVGAGLDFEAARGRWGTLSLGAGLKLVLMPVLMLGFCMLYGVEGTARAAAIACGACPTASGAYVLARQMGGDGPLMAALIAATTAGALVTFPFALEVLAP